jgi:hypothetical protein
MRYNNAIIFIIFVVIPICSHVGYAFIGITPNTKVRLIGSDHHQSFYCTGPPHMSLLSEEKQSLPRRIVPPIPKQDTSHLTIQDHFRPCFIAKEFIIGAKYMTRLVCWLMLASLIARNISACLPILPTMGLEQLTDDAYQPHMRVLCSLEHFIKQKCGWITQGCFLKSITVGPIAEELAYRGLGQSIGFASNWAYLFVFAWVCSKSPIFGLFWLLGTSLGSITTVVTALKKNSALMNLVPMISRILSSEVILFPAHLQLLKMAKDQQQDNSPETSSADSNKPRNNGICKMVSTGYDTESSTRLQATVDRSLNLSARCFGSVMFAVAHLGIPVSIKFPRTIAMVSGLQYALLQKYIGTFISSFLVESRLVVNRGTLWGAIGAHITFNTLVSSNYCAHLVSYRIFYKTPLLSLHVISYVAILFFFTQKLLDKVVLVLERIENRIGQSA